jgi:hypothetical protein
MSKILNDSSVIKWDIKMQREKLRETRDMISGVFKQRESTKMEHENFYLVKRGAAVDWQLATEDEAFKIYDSFYLKSFLKNDFLQHVVLGVMYEMPAGSIVKCVRVND